MCFLAEWWPTNKDRNRGESGCRRRRRRRCYASLHHVNILMLEELRFLQQRSGPGKKKSYHTFDRNQFVVDILLSSSDGLHLRPSAAGFRWSFSYVPSTKRPLCNYVIIRPEYRVAGYTIVSRCSVLPACLTLPLFLFNRLLMPSKPRLILTLFTYYVFCSLRFLSYACYWC